MMFIDLYTDNLYSQKIRAESKFLLGTHSAISPETKTVAGVDYKYFYRKLIYSPLYDAGTEIANAVTNPAGDGSSYKSFYLVGGNRVDIKAYTTQSGSYWGVTQNIRLVVSNTEIFSYGSVRTLSEDPALHPEKWGIRFCSALLDGIAYYGFCYSDNPDSYCNCGMVTDNFFTQSIAPRYDGGAAGSDPQGGYGDNDTANSATTPVTNPGGILAATGAHGLHVYRLDSAGIGALYATLWQLGISSAIERTIAKPLTGIISLHKMPAITGRTGTLVTKINVAGWPLQAAPGETFTAYEDSTNIFTVETDPVYVGTLQNDFADFAATSAAIHLPFCGTYPIDIKSIMGGYIRLVYVFDTVQGNCACNVYTTNRNGLERLYGVYAGNCAYLLPVSGSEQGAGQIAGLISTIAGAASFAAGAAGAAGAAEVIGGMSAVGHGAVTQGNTGGNSAYYSHMCAELYIYRPQAVYPDSYAQQIGRPTACAGTVGNYSGFVSGTVHAAIAGATDDEKQEIEQALKQGVFV